MEYFAKFIAPYDQGRYIIFRHAPHMIIASSPKDAVTPEADPFIALSYFESPWPRAWGSARSGAVMRVGPLQSIVPRWPQARHPCGSPLHVRHDVRYPAVHAVLCAA